MINDQGEMDDRTIDKTVNDRVKNSPWIKLDQAMVKDSRKGSLIGSIRSSYRCQTIVTIGSSALTGI